MKCGQEQFSKFKTFGPDVSISIESNILILCGFENWRLERFLFSKFYKGRTEFGIKSSILK